MAIHVNPEGKTGKCVGADRCKYKAHNEGQGVPHFDTQEEAEAYIQAEAKRENEGNGIGGLSKEDMRVERDKKQFDKLSQKIDKAFNDRRFLDAEAEYATYDFGDTLALEVKTRVNEIIMDNDYVDDYSITREGEYEFNHDNYYDTDDMPSEVIISFNHREQKFEVKNWNNGDVKPLIPEVQKLSEQALADSGFTRSHFDKMKETEDDQTFVYVSLDDASHHASRASADLGEVLTDNGSSLSEYKEYKRVGERLGVETVEPVEAKYRASEAKLAEIAEKDPEYVQAEAEYVANDFAQEANYHLRELANERILKEEAWAGDRRPETEEEFEKYYDQYPEIVVGSIYVTRNPVTGEFGVRRSIPEGLVRMNDTAEQWSRGFLAGSGFNDKHFNQLKEDYNGNEVAYIEINTPEVDKQIKKNLETVLERNGASMDDYKLVMHRKQLEASEAFEAENS